MCFTVEMSAGMLVLGVAASALAFRHVNAKVATMLIYFSVMQVIHVLGYLSAGDCSDPSNRAMAYLNYLHICFQPLISTLGAWGFVEFAGQVDHDIRTKFRFALKLCLVGGVLMALRMFGQTSDEVHKSCIWCGKACSFEGKHHITFSLPLQLPSYTSPSLFIHMFLMFVPLLFISKLSAIISGTLALTAFLPLLFIRYSSISEAGTIWCFTSILQILVVFWIVTVSKALK